MNDGHYTEPRVMHSAAGWYIGSMYVEDDDFETPGDRYSGYFATREEASAVLPSYAEGLGE